MNYRSHILFVLIIFVFYFSAIKAQIPGSTRSKDAIKRNTDTLEIEFSKKGLTFGNNIFIRIFKESNELEVWIEETDTLNFLKPIKFVIIQVELEQKRYEETVKALKDFIM